MYLLAIILPPIAVLACGKPFQAILNFFLTLCFWFPGMIHAIFVVNSYKNEQNAKRIENAIIASARVAHQDAQPKGPHDGFRIKGKDIKEFKKNPDKFLNK